MYLRNEFGWVSLETLLVCLVFKEVSSAFVDGTDLEVAIDGFLLFIKEGHGTIAVNGNLGTTRNVGDRSYTWIKERVNKNGLGRRGKLRYTQEAIAQFSSEEPVGWIYLTFVWFLVENTHFSLICFWSLIAFVFVWLRVLWDRGHRHRR